MRFDTIAVLGLGKVGLLAAELLRESGLEVLGIDSRPPGGHVFATERLDAGDPQTLARLFARVDAVLSCLPHGLNAAVARAAHAAGIHYFDLTEDIATSALVRELGTTATGVMAPQCGLAPGFIGIVSADLATRFSFCRSLRLRVGALPQHPTGLLGYAFNWSPEGVVNEYLNDCEVIEDGVRKKVSSMEWLEQIYVKGVHLEAFTTSGGLGTLCETFHGRVANLDYKSLRYPGHARLMNFFFHELLMREHRELAGNILTNAKPPVADDVVYVHVAAEGMREQQLWREEFVAAYYPRAIGGAARTAIAWTTAGSVVAVIELVRRRVVANRGFIKQEDIPLEAFLATPTGSLFADAGTAGGAQASTAAARSG